MLELFQKKKKEKPPYLERLDELKNVSIVRFKGNIDQSMIPTIEARIKSNRQSGSKIDKNVLLDFAKVERVDSATIAFHIVRLHEYQQKGFKIGFVHVPQVMRYMLEMFKENGAFKIYDSEEEAIKELDR